MDGQRDGRIDGRRDRWRGKYGGTDGRRERGTEGRIDGQRDGILAVITVFFLKQLFILVSERNRDNIHNSFITLHHSISPIEMCVTG